VDDNFVGIYNVWITADQGALGFLRAPSIGVFYKSPLQNFLCLNLFNEHVYHSEFLKKYFEIQNASTRIGN
jgi:hypothetical protein